MTAIESNRGKGSLLSYKRMRAMRDRTVVTLIMTVFLVATIALILAFIRPATEVNRGIQPKAFLAMKAQWRHCATVVAGGDSRTVFAICPQEMRKVMGNLQILNCGFLGTGFSDAYCQWLENVLIPDADRKIIILCVTPLSLTAEANRVNEFTEYVQKETKIDHTSDTMDTLLSPFAPLSAPDIRKFMSRKEFNCKWTERFSDGWTTTDIKYPEIDEGLSQYRDLFSPTKGGPVVPSVMKRLMRHISEWKEKGIEIYGFRPPTCHDMEIIEKETAHFDENTFVEQFKLAGGTWFSFDRDAYFTWDGSHLLRESSMRLSEELARKIVNVR